MTAVEAIRKYKWPLIGLQVLTVVSLAVSLIATQGQALEGIRFALVYGSAFLASLVWFPLCYLAWFGRPNHPVLTAFGKLLFWFIFVAWLFFWARLSIHLLGR